MVPADALRPSVYCLLITVQQPKQSSSIVAAYGAYPTKSCFPKLRPRVTCTEIHVANQFPGPVQISSII